MPEPIAANTQSFRNRFLLVACVLIWGSSFILMKKGLVAFGPTEVAALRLSIAGACMLPVAVRLLRNRQHYPWFKLIIACLTGNLLPAYLFTWAQTGLPSGTVGVLNALTPLFTLLLGAWFFGVPILIGRAVGIVLGLAGAMVLLLPNALKSGMGDVAFALPVVVATLLYATNVNYIKYQLHALKPLEIAAFALVLAGIPSFVYLSMGTGFWGKVLPLSSAAGSDAVWQSLMAVGILGAVGSALSLWLFFMLVASAGPLYASAITYLMPVVALGWALLDGESPGWMHVTALGLILVGVWLVGKKPAHPKTQ